VQAWKLGPALATGCAVVLKPAPQTPLTALRIAELAVEAGFPKGAINIVPGDDETGKTLVRNTKLDKLAFTGSTAVGKEIMKTAAAGLKRVTLELGGKSPMIVLDDADIDTVVKHARTGIFFNQGQVCCAMSRVFVPKKHHDEFIEKMEKETKTINVGAGWDPNTHQGPQVSKEQFNTVHSFIKAGISQGATLVHGGPDVAESGFFIKPTIFADVKDDMKIGKFHSFIWHQTHHVPLLNSQGRNLRPCHECSEVRL
jgi:aldehyde dehydrogenase (NAD+)